MKTFGNEKPTGLSIMKFVPMLISVFKPKVVTAFLLTSANCFSKWPGVSASGHRRAFCPPLFLGCRSYFWDAEIIETSRLSSVRPRIRDFSDRPYVSSLHAVSTSAAAIVCLGAGANETYGKCKAIMWSNFPICACASPEHVCAAPKGFRTLPQAL